MYKQAKTEIVTYMPLPLLFSYVQIIIALTYLKNWQEKMNPHMVLFYQNI